MTILLICGANILAGCATDPLAKLRPIPQNMHDKLAQHGLNVGSDVFVRIFKEEKQLELWLENPYGKYTHVKTYPICNMSGELGPKLKEGDRQAPEGFYMVSQKQLNPRSQYHLSINVGYPNQYDSEYQRTGKHLMIHGGCSSRGCYAITNPAVNELFVFAYEAFKNGQKQIPIHIFPFKMDADNLAKHAHNQWAPFWRNLSQGYHYFKKTKTIPHIGVKNKKYVFMPKKQNNNQSKIAKYSPPEDVKLIQGW